jgi:hypothetical protein
MSRFNCQKEEEEAPATFDSTDWTIFETCQWSCGISIFIFSAPFEHYWWKLGFSFLLRS